MAIYAKARTYFERKYWVVQAQPQRLIIPSENYLVADLFGNDRRYDQPLKGAICSNGLIHKDIVGIARLHKL